MPKSNPDDVGKRVAWARHCALCDKQQTFESGSLGTLLGPVGEDAAGLPIFVHRLCALWSPEVYQTDQGTLRCVMAAVKRGRAMRCCECQQRGATIGCRLERCPLSFHLHCAALRAGAAGCTFYPDKYMVACAEHAPLFKHEAQQNRVFPQSPYRAPAVPRGASRHQQPDAPEVSEQRPHKKRRQGGVDPAVHMRLAHEALKSASIGARAYENESSDDEEHFRKKERQRIIRDRAKLNPLVLGAGGRAQAAGSVQAMAGDPTGRNDVDLEGWDAVGGHEAAVKQLKEMVLLPLLYPDLFRQMNIHPPRGILFHGPPGTGKTLVARALAGACSLHSPKPVTFFARKGADCLGKFAGEAERTLRLLFDEASRAAPSIIFLDELDGLVPARSARSGGSDQIYASVVSTLLALMDGITDRGAVVVIGATNRPEAIDPALRRPGRFDREVYFGLPTLAERNAILAVHTRKWPERPSPRTLEAVAGAAEGFAGADLQALCSAAVLAAVQRQAPRLIDQLDQQVEAAPSAGAPAQAASVQGAAGQLQACTNGNVAVGTEDKIGRSEPGLPSSSAPSSATMDPAAGNTCADQCPASAGRGTGLPDDMGQLATCPSRADSLPTSPAAPVHPQHPTGSNAAMHALSSIKVKLCDWRAALASRPAPCSRRQGLAVITADQACGLSPHLAPLLLPHLAELLARLHACNLPLSALGAAASSAAAVLASACSKGKGDSRLQESRQKLHVLLEQLGAINSERTLERPQGSSTGDAPGMQGSESQQHVAIERASASLPCKLLIGGKGEVGQAPLAAALLQVVQEAPLHLLSLPVLVVEGEGDAALGCVRLLAEAFRRATTSQPIVLFLPRLDAWAVSRVVADPDEVDEAETVECQQPPALPTTSPFRGLLPIGARGSLVDEPMASPRRAEAHREAVVHAGQPTSPRHLTQQQQATKRALVKGCYQGTTADKDGVSTPGVEISVLSDVWNVFEQVLKQASSSQPILVLATTNMDPISLPPALLSFFGGQAAVDGCVGGDGQTAAGSGQPSSMVMLGSSSPEAWREAMAAALDLASEAIANTLTPEGHRDASKRHRSHLPEQAERSAPLRPAAGVQRAEPWAVMNSVAAGLATAPDYNENELREGVQLHERVVTAICLVSQRLWSDPRARAVSAAQASAGAPVDGREERESLLDVTKRAIAGGYNSLEEFQQAVQLTAEAVRRARGSGSRGHGGGNNEGRGHSTRAAAASALADEVASWCHSLRSHLRLDQPHKQRLLRLGRAHIQAQQQGVAGAGPQAAPGRQGLPNAAAVSPARPAEPKDDQPAGQARHTADHVQQEAARDTAEPAADAVVKCQQARADRQARRQQLVLALKTGLRPAFDSQAPGTVARLDQVVTCAVTAGREAIKQVHLHELETDMLALAERVVQAVSGRLTLGQFPRQLNV